MRSRYSEGFSEKRIIVTLHFAEAVYKWYCATGEHLYRFFMLKNALKIVANKNAMGFFLRTVTGIKKAL